jgi:hypothetical protein
MEVLAFGRAPPINSGTLQGKHYGLNEESSDQGSGFGVPAWFIKFWQKAFA